MGHWCSGRFNTYPLPFPYKCILCRGRSIRLPLAKVHYSRRGCPSRTLFRPGSHCFVLRPPLHPSIQPSRAVRRLVIAPGLFCIHSYRHGAICPTAATSSTGMTAPGETAIASAAVTWAGNSFHPASGKFNVNAQEWKNRPASPACHPPMVQD